MRSPGSTVGDIDAVGILNASRTYGATISAMIPSWTKLIARFAATGPKVRLAERRKTYLMAKNSAKLGEHHDELPNEVAACLVGLGCRRRTTHRRTRERNCELIKTTATPHFNWPRVEPTARAPRRCPGNRQPDTSMKTGVTMIRLSIGSPTVSGLTTIALRQNG